MADGDVGRLIAQGTIRGSLRHLVLSVVMGVTILAWYATSGAPRSTYVVIVAIGVFLVAYNVSRITRARRALAAPEQLADFAAGQRRSHRVRGRIFLVAAPVVLALTWIGSIVGGTLSRDSWIVLSGITIFLAVAWFHWFRVVRRLG
jgi:hypothetical protein